MTDHGSAQAVAALIVLALWIAVSWGVARHANNRGRSGLAWGLVVFFGGVIGLFIYIFAAD